MGNEGDQCYSLQSETDVILKDIYSKRKKSIKLFIYNLALHTCYIISTLSAIKFTYKKGVCLNI